MKFRHLLLGGAFLAASLSQACAQSSPGLYNGQVPSAVDWNSYFAAKQDHSTRLDALSGIGAGTATTVLHGNASGPPSFSQVTIPDISATGTPSSTTCLHGDGTWGTCGGGGGSPLTVGDGTTSVPATTTLSFGAGFQVSTTGTGLAGVDLTAPNIPYSANHNVGPSDMGGNLFLTGSATLTVPAISSTVFANQQTLRVTNKGSGVWQWASTPTINGLDGPVIMSGGNFCLVSNGTSLDGMMGSRGTLAPAAIAISTATFTPSGAYLNYTVALSSACPCTLANPAVVPNPGTEGTIRIVQDGTGGRTIGTWGSDYVIEGSTSGITLSTGANADDLFAYHVDSGSRIHLTFASKGAAH